MNSNIEDRSVPGKMHPIDLATQKITIVKSVSNSEVKMAHLISGQPKVTGPSQIIAHASPGTSLMRPGLAQIISTNVASQAQMIIGGSPILQSQIVSQNSQLNSQNNQMSQSQLVTPSGPILSPTTQIISQGTQLSAQVSNSSSVGPSNAQAGVTSPVSGTQVINVGGQLVTGTGNLVVNSSVRTLASTVRVIPPLPHHNAKLPAAVLSNVNVSAASGMLVSKSIGVGVTSHVPRGLAAGASLAVRPVVPTASSQSTGGNLGAWSGSGTRGPRSAFVYGQRNTRATAPVNSQNQSTQGNNSSVVTLPTTSVHTSSGISSNARGVQPRAPTPTPVVSTPRPLPLLQRNYQPAKVVGVASVGVRGVVGNSAPAQLYYEVPRGSTVGTHNSPPPAHPPHHVPASLPSTQHVPVSLAPIQHVTSSPAPTQHASASLTPSQHVAASLTPSQHVTASLAPSQHVTASLAPSQHVAASLVPTQHVVASHVPLQTVARTHTTYLHQSQPHLQHHAGQLHGSMNVVVASTESRTLGGIPTQTGLPRPSILRKRDIDSSPSKVTYMRPESTGWEDVPAGCGGSGGSGGSTTISAASSPARDDEPLPPEPVELTGPVEPDVSPRKKPRKQILINEVRQCDFQREEPPPTPPPVTYNPPPKRPLLSSSYVCGWRSTALHFTRPGDVRRREPRARDILAIAAQRHVLASARGWKVHHLTAQMDDLMQLESDVEAQLAELLRALDTASGRALAALKPHTHTLFELLQGNKQRSKIVCEGIQEARDDVLRVFTHKTFVSDILTRQADKRCFRKHRSQS